MFTVCPKCALTLAVTAADLRIGQGYVRCGRCASVFNALAGLHDEGGPNAGSSTPAAPPRPLPEAPPVAEPTAVGAAIVDEITLPDEEAIIYEGSLPLPGESESFEALRDTLDDEVEIDLTDDDAIDLNDDGAIDLTSEVDEDDSAADETPDDLEFRLRGQDLEDIFVEASNDDEGGTTGTFETIVLEGEGYLQTEEWVPEEEVRAEISSIQRGLDGNARDGSLGPVDEELAEVAARARDATAPNTSGTAQFPALTLGEELPAIPAPESLIGRPYGAREPDGPSPALWGSLAGVFALMLLAQIVHFYRHDLAAGALHGPLTALYGAIGLPLAPDWDVGAYEVRQLGAVGTADANGHLVVRASIANRATRAQPLPLLRLTLQDRYGKRIAGRDVEPGEYLTAEPDGTLLAPGQRADAEITVADPGRNATGFEIDACVPVGAGLTCAADAASPR